LTNESWQNPWKLAAVAMALVIVTVVATGLVVANWGGRESDKKVVNVATPSAVRTTAGTGLRGSFNRPGQLNMPDSFDY
jgi:hypothetical protein